jgi:GT2 family glycosyltransferase
VGPDDYETWVVARETAWMADSCVRLAGLARRPLLSVVVPTWETPTPLLRASLDSVLAQTYGRWELCVTDDGSESPAVRDVLAEYAAADPRIRVERLPEHGGIARATNAALARATGEFVGFLDHDDTLAPFALADVALHLAAHPDTDVLYSDEDRLDPAGRRVRPFLKPGWSPELLRSANYVCHFLVARRTLVERVGGIRPGFEGAQDYDLILRLSEHARVVGHLPKILYHWRAAPGSSARDVASKPAASDAGARALGEHLARRGEDAAVDAPAPTQYRVRHPVAGAPRVALVAVSRDADRVRRLVATLATTRYPHWRLVVVGAGSASDSRVDAVPWTGEANDGAMRNAGVARAAGDFVVFLHDDVEVVDPGWLDELLGHGQRRDVGAVGPMLAYPDGTIQHAGFVVAPGGRVGRPFAHLPCEHAWIDMGATIWTRDCAAVSGACMLVRRAHVEMLGGFDARLDGVAADVDLCVRLRDHGLRVVYTPHTRLMHHGCDDGAAVVTTAVDPFYNPNLGPSGDGTIATGFGGAETVVAASASDGVADDVREALAARDRSLLALQAMVRRKNAELAEATARLARWESDPLGALARRALASRPWVRDAVRRLLRTPR